MGFLGGDFGCLEDQICELMRIGDGLLNIHGHLAGGAFEEGDDFFSRIFSAPFIVFFFLRIDKGIFQFALVDDDIFLGDQLVDDRLGLNMGDSALSQGVGERSDGFHVFRPRVEQRHQLGEIVERHAAHERKTADLNGRKLLDERVHQCVFHLDLTAIGQE